MILKSFKKSKLYPIYGIIREKKQNTINSPTFIYCVCLNLKAERLAECVEFYRFT